MSSFVKYLGKEFEYGAMGPDKYDCYNLCRQLYKDADGSELPVFDSPSEPSIINEIVLKGKELFNILSKPEYPCLILFTIKYPYVSHVGFMLPDNRSFMHIMRKSRVTIEKLDHVLWRNRIRGYVKYK